MFDRELIPKDIKETKSTDFDFNAPHRRIGERRDGCYDHCFILECLRCRFRRHDGCYDHCFILDNPKSKKIIVTNGELTLSVKTDLPAVQLYTSRSLNLGFKGK